MTGVAFALGLIALVGIVLTSVQVLLARRFARGDGQASASFDRTSRFGPFVSILKPVCGLDDELEANLLSFVGLKGIRHEVIISAEEWSDPAIEIVRRVVRAYPQAPFRIVVDPGSRNGVVNRKVERLIAAARAASGEILFISDSNMRVEPSDLAHTVAMFDDDRVGCVSNLFTGAGARTLGAAIESLHLLGFVVPGVVLGHAVGTPCVVGKSMAISRRAHDAIGGFERFRRVLAEDQAIGLAVRDAGYDVRLSPVVVRNVIVDRSVRRAVERQVRWDKIRYSFSRPLYCAELVINPLVFSILAALTGPPKLAAFPLLVMFARVLQLALLNRAVRAALTWKQLAATPLLDVLMFCAWLVPFFSDEVTWRGYRARIGRDTEMIELAA